MRHVRGLFAPWLVLAILAVGASPSAATSDTPSGQMVWAVHVSLAPTWFDPAETSGIITPFMVLYALHDAALKPLPGYAMTPSLAESWSTSPDGLVYEFVLRKSARFHNGDPVTAEDVKFSFERYRGASAKPLKDSVAAIETPDPGRVRFRLKRPWPDFMTFFCDAAITFVGEPVVNYLNSAGIRVRLRPIERVAFFRGWAEKKHKGLIQGGSGAFGNAATRIEAFVAAGGAYVYGSYADIDGLFLEQVGELDPKRREATLHRIQQLIHDKAMIAPIWLNAGLAGLGPRVEESGIGLIAGYAFSAPYEDVKLKSR
jgi:ABC-type transport system substrate-binding protein